MERFRHFLHEHCLLINTLREGDERQHRVQAPTAGTSRRFFELQFPPHKKTQPIPIAPATRASSPAITASSPGPPSPSPPTESDEEPVRQSMDDAFIIGSWVEEEEEVDVE